MKRPILFFLLLIGTLFTACEEDAEPTGNSQDIIVEWVMGGDLLETSEEINSAQSTKLTLRMATDSFCPNSGIYVDVFTDNLTLYQEVVIDFPLVAEIEMPIESTIFIRMEVGEGIIGGVECVWLGEVSCRIEY